ncbi:BRO family protein [Saccharopolyspora sp. NPDC002686]|uniref:BRO family protein n=1 Tax=Saccharopolyspora sp. NPDC002686 TaxID=3154541 RepID=UPI00331D4CC7
MTITTLATPNPNGGTTLWDYHGARVRTVVLGGEPWFVAADVCAVLGYAHTASALRGLRPAEKGVRRVHTPGGEQDVTLINEPGLYRLVMRSNRPEAEAFQDWVTGEVLPAIRRTGRYDPAAQPRLPQTYAEALRELATRVEAHEQTRRQLATAAPKAHSWDALAAAGGDFSIREAAHILNRDPAITTGERRLFAALRELGMLDRRNIPYAKHARHLVERPTTFTDPRTGERRPGRPQPRLTVEGLHYVHRKLGGIARPRLAAPPLPLGDTGAPGLFGDEPTNHAW